MMMAPQVVGVLLKKPGQQNHPRITPLDRQETKIRGELYVENLAKRKIVMIRMGWLWVEGTSMQLALRALNLRQAAPSLCQPHALALGFTLSDSQGHSLATFWADTEPIYWSWVKAIATELVRQTPFRARRCLNFLEILTICPRSPAPFPESLAESRRRSRSEFRCWPIESSIDDGNSKNSTSILEESRRRARSELRGWSSSNSSDEDNLGEFRSIPAIISTKDQTVSRTWGCSESSEGSDDSLPWGVGICRSSVDSVDSTVSLSEPETKEQRIQRYKETRRRENEARSRRVLEEDARRRKARAEENNNNNKNNNNNELPKIYGPRSKYYSVNENDDHHLTRRSPKKESSNNVTTESAEIIRNENDRLPPIKPVEPFTVRFEETDRTVDGNDPTRCSNGTITNGILRTDANNERRSRTRERRIFREKGQSQQAQEVTTSSNNVESLQERKERLAAISSRIPVPRQLSLGNERTIRSVTPSTASLIDGCMSLPRSATTMALSILKEPPCEEDVARLLERCQRVDHYVPVREKLTLFESLSRLGGRLARSTEDLGRSESKPSPRGKQRARSLHDLNRGARSVPVREMCRFFEGDVRDTGQGNQSPTIVTNNKYSTLTKNSGKLNEPLMTTSPRNTTWKDNNTSTTSNKSNNDAAPCVRTSTRKKHYAK
ncbi:general transcriptional corepressor trfA-like [Polistes fuscatus]|uniref:general transcriptional corepressor trfA-like n=1 Tax=Polistes fuscatus TaxID=30207 RepID=UPI001CAA2AF3|nr:general transcriptional corepressor trfA-like [Polistes fuscatus]